MAWHGIFLQKINDFNDLKMQIKQTTTTTKATTKNIHHVKYK